MTPAAHRLNSALTAAFLGRAAAAGRLLAERGLPGRPALFWPGRTLVVVAYQEFIASPVGPYRQVSVSLPVHVPSRPGARPPRAPWPWPLLAQALWNTDRVFRNLHFYVVAIPVSKRAAVAYSADVWGEPAWLAQVTAGAVPLARVGDLEVTVRDAEGPGQAEPAGAGEVFLTLRGRTGGLGFTERRNYRLVSRLGPDVLTDTMRVEAPARLGFGPGRAGLALGPSPRADALRPILGERPFCVQSLAHGPGTVVFGGPAVLGGQASLAGRAEGAGTGVTPLGR